MEKFCWSSLIFRIIKLFKLSLETEARLTQFPQAPSYQIFSLLNCRNSKLSKKPFPPSRLYNWFVKLSRENIKLLERLSPRLFLPSVKLINEVKWRTTPGGFPDKSLYFMWIISQAKFSENSWDSVRMKITFNGTFPFLFSDTNLRMKPSALQNRRMSGANKKYSKVSLINYSHLLTLFTVHSTPLNITSLAQAHSFPFNVHKSELFLSNCLSKASPFLTLESPWGSVNLSKFQPQIQSEDD